MAQMTSALAKETADFLRFLATERSGPSEVRLVEHLDEPNLSPREFEVLCLIRDGYRNEQIAYQLAIAETTVNFHIKNITSKLQANERAHAVTVAFRRGLPQV